MESEANKILVIPRPVRLFRDVRYLHEDILRHIVTFLEFQSILQLRLVSAEWNAAGIAILMKRGYYDLTYPCMKTSSQTFTEEQWISPVGR
jgi:hypothetical protein